MAVEDAATAPRILARCALVWLAAAAAAATLATAKPCCFSYKNWHNPCTNVTCPNNAQCVPAVNTQRHHKCTCINDCWDVGDSEDSGPVCGSDGRTYASRCHLQRASCHAVYHVTVRYKGECDPCEGTRCPPAQRCVLDSDRGARCVCTECKSGNSAAGRQLVCGTDGKTYQDQCTLEYDSCRHGLNISKLADGQCPTGVHCQTKCQHPYMECRVDPGTGQSRCSCPADCPAVLSPVCGSDGATYESACHLRQRACLENRRGVQPSYRGACDQPAWCRRPLGGCRHGGVCRVSIAEAASGRSWSVAATCERPDCLKPEDAGLARVCGSDGATYASECHLRQRAFDQRNDSLAVTSPGSCNPCRGFACPYYGFCQPNIRGEPECRCPNHCVYAYNPVCGSDGRTYDLECELRFEACHKSRDIAVVSQGSCPSPPVAPPA